MKEEWRTILGFENYQVSNTGMVRNAITGRMLKQRKDKYGYLVVALYKRSSNKWIKVHRLVALAFIPNPENKPCVNHKNEIKDCNAVWNLEWMTVAENNAYGTRASRISKAQKGRSHDYMKGDKNYFHSHVYARGDHPKAKNVYQYSKDDTLISVFGCTKDAADAVGVSASAISLGCRGVRKTIAGYKWSYFPIAALTS